MIQATSNELQKIIDDELQRNIVLEPDETRSVDQLSDNDSKDEPIDDEVSEPNDEAYDGNEDKEDSDDSVKDIDEGIDYGDYDDDNLPNNNSSQDDKEYSPFNNYGSDTSFRDSLKKQLSELELTERERFLANYLVDSLEDDGYLRRKLYDLSEELAWNQNFDTTEEELELVLTDVVQANLEPSGIGARDLRECLLLQLLDKKATADVQNAYKVIDEAFEDFSANRLEKLKTRFNFSDNDIKNVQRVVRRLNPKPGGIDAGTDTMQTKTAHVRPDFIVTREDDQLVVSLCDSHVPAVRVSPDYSEMLKRISKEKSAREDVKQGKAMIENGIRSANLFIKALIQRRRTLLAVMEVIVNCQREFFLTGKQDLLKPMTLKYVSELSGYDISTVSRVSNSKYVQSDFGTYAIKDLFITGLTNDEGTVQSTAAILEALKQIVDTEDKHSPLNDDQITTKLAEMGYKISRRTVVKYREKLNINKANLRKII